MLRSMRKGAGGWLAKGLLLLLVASFAVWGIGGDMLSSSVDGNVIEVGETSVSLGEFQRDYQRNVNILSQRFQTQLTAEQARQFGLAQMTVNQIASRALLAERTNQLGLSADDAAIRETIQTIPVFQNELKQFDRYRFQSFLQQNGYGEAEYVNIVRNDITGRQLMESLTQPITTAPKILLDTLYAYHAEKRSARYVEILDSSIALAPAPTDEELTEFITNNSEKFSAPEYRKISYLYLKPENFIEDTDVSADDLKAEYDGRISEFSIPEQRGIQQMIFDNEDTAKAALAQINSGSTFIEVALSELQLTPEDLDLGLMSQQDLLPDLQGPVYNLQKDGVSKPIKTILGWHLIKVTDIKPEATQTSEDVKAQLTRDIQLRAAYDVMFRQATKLEDEFAGGASLSEGGETVGVDVVTTDFVDATGRNKAGQPAEGLPNGPNFLAEAFVKSAGGDVEMSEAPEGGYFAILVDEITDATLKPLADVKVAATADWQAAWRGREAKKQADALLEKASGGETLEELAKSLGAPIQTTPAIARSGEPGNLSREFQKGLFDLQSAAFGVGPNAAGNGYLLYTIAETIPANINADKAAAKQMSEQIAGGVRASIRSQYENYLQTQIGVSVKENLIREYY